MLTLKVPLKETEKVRRSLIEKNVLDTDYPLKKEGGFIFIPVKEKFESRYKFAEKALEKNERNESLKDILKGKLTPKETESLKTAYDHVGDIAIIEIDKELLKKEKVIADALLKSNKTIKTVLKKGGVHSGEFRTQKMVYLAGERKKETIHKENNIRLTLDVEKVYFSPRLSTERKRIAQLVKPNEEILVMFSGCAPYPCVLSKNTKAKNIVGIEMNPAGHKYGLLNVKLNKLDNVMLYNGDVNKIVPLLEKKPVIGLKSSWKKEHLKNKLKENPKLLEIYLSKGDLEDHYEEVISSIKELKKKGIKIVLHSPNIYNGTESNMSSGDKKTEKNTVECLMLLEKMCQELDLSGFVAHPYFFTEKRLKKELGASYNNTKKNLHDFLKKNKYQHMSIENTPWGFFSEPKEVIETVNKFNLNLCCDIAHTYLWAKSENDFYLAMSEYSQKQPYFHIADAKYLGVRNDMGFDHSSPIGEGKVNFSRILPFIKEGVIEVQSRDELNPKEMITSFRKINLMIEKEASFDRILMPLPKSAEDFLPCALSLAKKGTIIHFYDFLKEDEFSLAHKKIDKACKKKGLNYKILKTVKCGQHAPRVFRICVDFQIV